MRPGSLPTQVIEIPFTDVSKCKLRVTSEPAALLPMSWIAASGWVEPLTEGGSFIVSDFLKHLLCQALKCLLLILPDPLFGNKLVLSKLSLLFSQAVKGDTDVSFRTLITWVFFVACRHCMMMLNRTYVSSLLDCRIGRGCWVCLSSKQSAGFLLAPVTAFLPEN